jgi:lipoprotein LprG
MRKSLAVPAVASAVIALAVGCSSASSPPSPSSPPLPPPSPSPTPSSSKHVGEPLPDPAALLKEASTTTDELKSVHLALSVTGKVARMPVTTLESDLTEEPKSAAKGKARITIMGADVGIEFVEVGRRMYVALPGVGFRDYGRAPEIWDVTAMLDPHAGLANMLAEFIDPTVEARETVDGQQTVRISGKVSADDVNNIVPLDAAKRMPSTVWIQESGDHQLVQAKLGPSKDDFVQMALSKWNAPVTVNKPK